MSTLVKSIFWGWSWLRHFLKFCHIFGIGEAGHFNFRILIDTEEYSCMHDTLFDVFRVM